MALEPKRILLLMDNRGDANWGSQATTAELVQLIRARFPGAELRSLSRHAAGSKKWTRSIGYRWAPFGPLSDWRDSRGNLARNLLMRGWPKGLEDWPDLTVVNGEGTLHPQVQTRMWLPLIDWLRRKSAAPLWIVNTSIMFRGEEQRDLFQAVLAKADRIVLREPASYRLCKEQGWNAVQGADCAFLAEPQPVAAALAHALDLDKPYIVATGAATSREWDLEAAKGWIDALRQRCPNVVFAASTPTDRSLHAALGQGIPILTEAELNYRQLLQLIGGASLHFGGRYHPTIFAAMAGTPFVALSSNTHKMEGVMEWIGAGGPLLGHADDAAIRRAIHDAPAGQRLDVLAERCRELREFSKANLFAG